jgi:CheY-like chemotaxis protein
MDKIYAKADTAKKHNQPSCFLTIANRWLRDENKETNFLKSTKTRHELFIGKKALIVEDNEALAYELSEYMEEFSILADFARDGKQALEMLGQNNYDFILMDIYMPVMNGFEATTKIMAAQPASKIIVITSTSERLEYERIKALGAKDCVLKPISKHKLLDMILKQLEINLSA